MTQPYSSIAVHPELGKPTKKYPRSVLFELIKMLNVKVWPFISVYHDFDVVGQFYGEFLKYIFGKSSTCGGVKDFPKRNGSKLKLTQEIDNFSSRSHTRLLKF